MSLDYSKIQMSSENSSNKVWKQDSGSFSVPALGGAGETNGQATIAHKFSSANLLFQVVATTDTGGTSGWAVLPWESNDARVIQYAMVDSTNLTVVCISSDASGLGSPARTVNYVYRLLIP